MNYDGMIHLVPSHGCDCLDCRLFWLKMETNRAIIDGLAKEIDGKILALIDENGTSA
jgi:hypothetical protein